MEAVGPWVQDCIRLMDADGAFIGYKEAGALSDQPHMDMIVFDAVRSKWCELKNKDMESKYGKKAVGRH